MEILTHISYQLILALFYILENLFKALYNKKQLDS